MGEVNLFSNEIKTKCTSNITVQKDSYLEDGHLELNNKLTPLIAWLIIHSLVFMLIHFWWFINIYYANHWFLMQSYKANIIKCLELPLKSRVRLLSITKIFQCDLTRHKITKNITSHHSRQALYDASYESLVAGLHWLIIVFKM